MTAWRSVLVPIALVALSIGCKRSGASADVEPRVPVERAEIDEALKQNRSDADSVRRYQGFVRIRGRGPEGGFSGRLVVIFERPSSLRIELLGAFGATRWAAVATESGIRVVFPGPRQYVEERDVADVVGRLLGVRLEPNEVMALMSGSGVELATVEPSEAYRQGATRVVLFAGGGRLELSDEDQILSAQTRSYRARYPTSWKRARRQIPDRLELTTDQISATLTVEAVDVNVALDDEAFTLEVPAGAVRLEPSDVAGEAVFVASPSPPRKR